MNQTRMYPEVRRCAHCDGPSHSRFCSQRCAEARYAILIHALHRMRLILDGKAVKVE